MSDAIPRAAGSAPTKWQYRFGLKFVLATVLFAALFLGWVMRTKKEEAAAPPPLTRDQELLTEIRDLLRKEQAEQAR